jgi:hypothetical protein
LEGERCLPVLSKKPRSAMSIGAFSFGAVAAQG